jgi:membrane-bound lytic murein transglycosylase D
MVDSRAHFERGEVELGLGHLAEAKTEFNRALDLLLESPYGARSNPRLREHFDRLVDQISAYEIRALAVGDGFTEKPSQPASLDALLAMSTFAPSDAQAELRDAVTADLVHTPHDIPITLNSKVLSYVDLFQGRLRDWFQTALQRGMAYIPMIQSVLRAEGLPLDLAYIPVVESAFHPDALSAAKAKGVWQLMHGTAVEQGLRHDWYIDERSDPEKATVAAAKYLKLLNRMFDGNWDLTLASYNGGPGVIQRAVQRLRVTDFWKLADMSRYLRRETREYVPMVLAAMVIARNPAQYGFNSEPTPPPQYETVTLSSPVDLRRIAEWAGVPVEEVQRLNPALRRWTTPLRSDGFVLRVPVGTADIINVRLAETQADELAALQWYTVRKGESLTSIANRLRVRRTDLAEANYLSVRASVRPGQKLVIPRAPTTLLAARTDRPAPVLASTPAVDPNAIVGAVPAGPGAPDEVKVTYRVKKGDTLYSIAQAFQTTVAAIQTWNRLKTSRITAGDRLTVFTSRQIAGVALY